MSYILDALRKLERARRPQTATGLVTLGAPTPTRHAVLWPIVSGAALLVNVILFALLWWPTPPAAPPPGDAPATAAPTSPASAAATATSSPVDGPAARPADTARPPATPAPSTAAPSEPASRLGTTAIVGSAPRRSTPNRPGAAPSSHPTPAAPVGPGSTVERTPIVQAPMAPGPESGSVAAPPRPSQPPAAAEPAGSTGVPLGVPRLKLEVLVYSETPADRFVFINGRKYLEGQGVAEGLTLERIDQDGAVLSYGGQQFVLRE